MYTGDGVRMTSNGSTAQTSTEIFSQHIPVDMHQADQTL